MLAEQYRAIPIGGHAVRAVVSARRQTISVIAAGIENLGHFSVWRPLTHHVTNHVAEPEDAGWAPDRTLDKREPAGQLLNLRLLGNKCVEGWIQSYYTSHGGGFFRGRWRRTCNCQKCNGKDQLWFHLQFDLVSIRSGV